MDNFKKCSKCGEVKLLDCFSKNKTKKDGYNAECKKCSSEYKKNHYVGNLEKYKKNGAKYRSENLEKYRKYSAEYRAENPEKIKSTKAKWRAENPEKIKLYTDKYYAENLEKIKSRMNKYRENLPDGYIKKHIKQQTGVPYAHIAQDLIETKRLHILIKRKLKDLTK